MPVTLLNARVTTGKKTDPNLFLMLLTFLFERNGGPRGQRKRSLVGRLETFRDD